MWCDYELFRVKLFPRLTYSDNEVTDLVKYTLSGADAEVILTDHLTHVSTPTIMFLIGSSLLWFLIFVYQGLSFDSLIKILMQDQR